MFKYLGNITDLSHHIIDSFVDNKIVALDGTLGNGWDCDFLSEKFEKVYAFDIQERAIEQYKQKGKENVSLIFDSHENVEQYITEGIDAAIYNLGFLPGGDKSVTTKASSTLKSIEATLKLLNSGGLLIIAVYVGHEEGAKEGEALLQYTSKLPKNKFGVMLHKVLNRNESSPYMLVIEKK